MQANICNSASKTEKFQISVDTSMSEIDLGSLSVVTVVRDRENMRENNSYRKGLN